MTGQIKLHCIFPFKNSVQKYLSHFIVKLQWLEHWDYENLFETGVVRATEG